MTSQTVQCREEELERLVLGELSLAEAAGLEAHARDCAACREELALLRSERAAFATRAAALESVPTAAFAAPAFATPVLARAPRSVRMRATIGAVMIVTVAAAAIAAGSWLVPQEPLTPRAALPAVANRPHAIIPDDVALESHQTPHAECTEDDFSDERAKLPPKNEPLSCDERNERNERDDGGRSVVTNGGR